MKITNEGFAIVERDTHLGKWVIEHKRLDFDQNALPTYLKYFHNNGVLLNVGANIGCYAFAFVKQAKKIVCLEPNPEAFECLVHNLSPYQNVHLIQKAITDKKTTCTVKSDIDNIGMAFIEEGSGETEAITIDSLKLEELSFILMDCEGFELKALVGAEKTISKYKPVMVIEINDHTLRRTNTDRKEIFAWLDEMGYIYRNIYANQGMNDDQLDIICFHKDVKTNIPNGCILG